MIGHLEPPPRLSRRFALAAPYVDNANVLSVGRAPGQKLRQAVLAGLRAEGLELHDEHVDEENFDFLGMRLLGGPGLLMQTPARTWRLYFALNDLAGGKGCRGMPSECCWATCCTTLA